MSSMESVKDLKRKILTKLVDDGTDVDEAKTLILEKYDAMAKTNPIFASNKQIAYNIIARELKVPCIVGCLNAMSILKDGDEVEVDADHGIVKILKKDN